MMLMLALAGIASAALVATDLNTGGTDTGFGAGWVGSSNIRITTAPDLTSALYGITQAGTVAKVYSANTSSTDRMDSRNLAAAMSGEIWFSCLVNVPAAGNWAGLAFDSDLTTGGTERYSHQLSELRVLLTPTQLVVDMDGGIPTATGTETGTFAAGSTHLILGKMNIVTGNDTLEIWVDPNVYAAGGPGGLPTANFTSTTVDFMDSVARIGVPISDSAANDSVHVDAIWLSDTATAFVDVTGVTGGDTAPPAVDALTPTNSANNVRVDLDLEVTFDEAVQKGTIGDIIIQQTAGGIFETIPVSSPSVTIDGAVVTITPSNFLAGTTAYYVEIDSGAFTDFAATTNEFAGISGGGTWGFTTKAIDVAPPIVSDLSPANGATEVSKDTDLVITFDEDVQKGASGNIVIQQTAGGTFETVAVTSPNVTIIGAVVTIVPSSDLAKGTGYYVEIDSGAFTDLASTPNAFAGISGSSIWSFSVSSGLLVATDVNTGGTDTGFSGDWYAGSNNAYKSQTNDLVYANYGITQTGTVDWRYASNAATDRQDCRDLATAMSGEIWFSALVLVPTGGDYAAFSINPTASKALYNYESNRAALRLWMTSSEIQVGFALSTATTGTGTFTADTTHLLLGKMDIASGNDTVSVWVDPDLTAVSSPSGLPAANYTETTVDFADSIVRIGAGGDSGSAAEVYIDAIRLSDTDTAFYDVTGVSGIPAGTVIFVK